MAYVYHKPPVYCYQTFDRQSLQHTTYPVFQVYNPPPPDATPPQDPGTGEGTAAPNDQPEVGGAAAGEIGETVDGRFRCVSGSSWHF